MKITLVSLCILMILISPIRSGQIIQEFRLKDVNDQWQRLSDLKGEKLTVIDFWATWCSPCAKALPKLNDMYKKYQKKGVQFIGLNMDSPKNNSKIKSFVAAYKIVYPVLKDPNSQLASRLNISSVPTLLIINYENEIVYRHIGYNSGDELIIEKELKKILGENPDE